MPVINVTYLSSDGYRKTSKFKTLKGARRFAQKWVGKCPDIGRSYAVSPDGIGRITATGVHLEDLFACRRTSPSGRPPSRPIYPGLGSRRGR